MAEVVLGPIAALAQELAEGKTTSRKLVEAALARIADAGGEGGRVFTKVHAQGALLAADASDHLRMRGVVPSPLAGLPVSIKDLFDIAGDVTTAGSKILRDAARATEDAVAVARLRTGGAVVIGRSNMSEFAFSGIGINPHYATPANPYDRGRRRIPGGSSSGAAVSVADGMAAFALGTDTGGSVRIPAALCGIAGFKPTRSRVPLGGAFPLSTTLDSVGPLAPTVACCATVFQILAGEPPHPLKTAGLAALRLGRPNNIMPEDLDIQVTEAFDPSIPRPTQPRYFPPCERQHAAQHQSHQLSRRLCVDGSDPRGEGGAGGADGGRIFRRGRARPFRGTRDRGRIGVSRAGSRTIVVKADAKRRFNTARSNGRLSAVQRAESSNGGEKPMKHKTLGAGAIVFAAALLAAGPALAQERVKIGFITTLSGPQGVVGEYMRN